MDKKEMLDKIKEIGTCTDDAQRRTMLTELTDHINNVFNENDVFKTENESLKTKNKEYETDNELLRQANMKMFLQLGSDKTEQETKEDTTGIKTPEESNKRSFEDLFNEKGGLK